MNIEELLGQSNAAPAQSSAPQQFQTVPMEFTLRPGGYPAAAYMQRLKWHLNATFGSGNYSLSADQPRWVLRVGARAVNPYAFAQFILYLELHRPSAIELRMRYPDGAHRKVVNYQAMRRYLFHHWDRPNLAGKTRRKFWGLHAGKNALPAYPWDDAFIAEDAKKRSRRLQQGAGY